MHAGANVLALDTATDACAGALALGEDLRCIHELAPRQHQQRLFTMLDEVAGGAALASLELDLIVYGRGPGSFTGLRIAAAAAQGLAFSLGLPVVGVSSLACQAMTAVRRRLASPDAALLSTIDARIGELYWGLYRAGAGTVEEYLAAAVCSPGELPAAAIVGAAGAGTPLTLIGSGAGLAAGFPAQLPAPAARHETLTPEARDLIPLGLAGLEAGAEAAAAAVAPLYLQGDERWKKLPASARRGP